LQILKTEHELNQERTKERDNTIARLRDEYQNSELIWKKEVMESSTNHCYAKERAGTVIFLNQLLLNVNIHFFF